MPDSRNSRAGYVQCAVCGTLPADTDGEEHLSSDEHRNMMELRTFLNAVTYAPEEPSDGG